MKTAEDDAHEVETLRSLLKMMANIKDHTKKEIDDAFEYANDLFPGGAKKKSD